MRRRGEQSAAAAVSAQSNGAVANGASADHRTLDMFESKSTPTSESKKPQENLSSVVMSLEARGYSVSLQDVAGWIVAEREMVDEWLRGDRDEAPKFLAKYLLVNKAPKPGLAKAEKPSNDSTDAVAVVIEDKINVTWGEEKLGIEGTYSSFVVGQVSATVALRPGESIVDAGERIYADLEKLGERFRERKKKSFLAALKNLQAEAKS